MSYELRYPDAAQALFEALSDDPFYMTLASAASYEAADARAAMLRYFDYSLVEADTHGRVIFADNMRNGAAAWSVPLLPEQSSALAEQKRSFIQRHLGNKCRQTYQTIAANMHAETGRYTPDNCWYLSIIGVAPLAQGRGLGRNLMEKILPQADAAGFATYLETFSPRNKLFYLRLGYDEVATISEPVTASEYTVMVRYPDALPA